MFEGVYKRIRGNDLFSMGVYAGGDWTPPMLSRVRILASIQRHEMINDSATGSGNSVDIDDRSI